jgi:phenylacetate-CoA ligase
MFKNVSREESFKKAVDIFKKAREKSPFYAEKYKHIDDIKDYQDWLEVPFLERNELYENTFPKSMDMLTRDLKGVVITSTGGSSGMARYGVLTYNELDRFVALQADALRSIGINSDDMIANLFLAGNLWPSFFSLAQVIEKLNATHLPVSGNIAVEEILKYMREFRPNVLLSLPTVFIFLADLIIEQGLDAGYVTTIAYAGEHMSAMTKSHIQKAFKNAKIHSLGYTSADCGLMGYQCLQCSAQEYHVPVDFHFLEIYNFEENRPCEEGESGEVVVTITARDSLPIIRYRIGDMAKYKKTACSCGDTNPVLILEGRAGEDFKLGGAYISMDAVEESIKNFVSSDGISANYQLIIEDVDQNKMKVTLKLESGSIQHSKKQKENIIKALKKNIPELKGAGDMGYLTTDVVFVNMGEIQRSPITGKIKHLLDLRIKE